jgi:hypothetical protein
MFSPRDGSTTGRPNAGSRPNVSSLPRNHRGTTLTPPIPQTGATDARSQTAPATVQRQNAHQSALEAYPPELRVADEAIESRYMDPVLQEFPTNPRVFQGFVVDTTTLQGCIDRSNGEEASRRNGEWQRNGRPSFSINGDPARLAIHPILGGSTLVPLADLQTAIDTPMHPEDEMEMRRLIAEYTGRTDIRLAYEILRFRNQ